MTEKPTGDEKSCLVQPPPSVETARSDVAAHRFEHLRFDVDAGVGTVVLDRPDKLNALTYDSYRELELLTRGVARDPRVRVLVIRGAGAAFCAGGDVHTIIGDLLPRDAKDHLEFARMTCDVVRNLREMPQPVIAQVHGMAAGAGAVIALASDLRYLGAAARFAFLFTKVGLTGADMGAAYLLPRIVGAGRAAELLLLGDTIGAEECFRIGLANRVVPDAELGDVVAKVARRLADGPATALQTTKRMIQRELDMDLPAALEGEMLAQALLLLGKDHAEFYAAWQQKRPPQWTGR
jgi:enoyl-CoA hydratase/carnithine racemase